MIRLLQVRLNDDTVEVNNGRPRTEVLPPALRREIEALKAAQEEIRDSLRRVGAPWKPARNPTPRGSSIAETRRARPSRASVPSIASRDGILLIPEVISWVEAFASSPRPRRSRAWSPRSVAGEPIKPTPKGPVSSIAHKMTGVAGELDKTRTGQPVQAKEKAIVGDLDELIAELERQCQGCRNGMAKNNPSRPALDSFLHGGTGGIGDLVPSGESARTGPSSPAASATGSSSRCPRGSRPSIAWCSTLLPPPRRGEGRHVRR